MKPLCIYHGNCADGFGAAWAVWHRFGHRFQYHAGTYQNESPDVAGRHVLMVDFSYKRAALLEMAKRAKSVVILDHHKTAADDLAGFREPASIEDWQDESLALVEGDACPIAALFDMERSGAGITWDFLHPNLPRPVLINYIEDRDLWRFKLPNSREVNAAVFSYPYDFVVWNQLIFGRTIAQLASDGEAIERKHHKDVAELVGVTQRRMVIGGISIPIANLPYTLTSDAGNVMAKGDETKIGACYWDTPEGRVFSLRSTDDGPDVSAIAKQYGGGGHAHASGFRMPLGWEGDQL